MNGQNDASLTSPSAVSKEAWQASDNGPWKRGGQRLPSTSKYQGKNSIPGGGGGGSETNSMMSIVQSKWRFFTVNTARCFYRSVKGRLWSRKSAHCRSTPPPFVLHSPALHPREKIELLRPWTVVMENAFTIEVTNRRTLKGFDVWNWFVVLQG